MITDIHPSGLYQLNKDDLRKASGTLAEAFFCYPFFSPAIPEEKRMKALLLMFEVEVRYALKKGAAFSLDGDINEVATWHFDMQREWDPLTFLSCIRFNTLLLIRLAGRESLRAFQHTAKEVEDHIRCLSLKPDTAYLSSVGIKPEYRGQHRMRKLLSPVLDAFGQKGFDVCLYTNVPENILRYESLGFTTIDAVRHSALPCSSYFMLKKAPGNIAEKRYSD
jgi:N-acetylglutamate synthase-like GNAT family acetyltransferase